MTILDSTAALILTCFVMFYLEIYRLKLTDCKVMNASADKFYYDIKQILQEVKGSLNIR